MSQGGSHYNEQLLWQNIDSFMVKVMEYSTSLFIFVLEVFKVLATPLKLVNQIDHINQPSFFSLTLYSQAHPCIRVRMLSFIYFWVFLDHVTTCFLFSQLLKNQDSCLHPQGISWFNSSTEEDSCSCYSGREPLRSKTSYANCLLFAPYCHGVTSTCIV